MVRTLGGLRSPPGQCCPFPEGRRGPVPEGHTRSPRRRAGRAQTAGPASVAQNSSGSVSTGGPLAPRTPVPRCTCGAAFRSPSPLPRPLAAPFLSNLPPPDGETEGQRVGPGVRAPSAQGQRSAWSWVRAESASGACGQLRPGGPGPGVGSILQPAPQPPPSALKLHPAWLDRPGLWPARRALGVAVGQASWTRCVPGTEVPPFLSLGSVLCSQPPRRSGAEDGVSWVFPTSRWTLGALLRHLYLYPWKGGGSLLGAGWERARAPPGPDPTPARSAGSPAPHVDTDGNLGGWAGGLCSFLCVRPVTMRKLNKVK